MGSGPQQLTGVVLCRAGADRLAFDAQKVTSIGAWTQASSVPHACRAFGAAAAPPSGRMVQAGSGEALGVDSLEVLSETVKLLPAGALVGRRAGGALLGFATIREQLWPVVGLVELAHFLEGAR